MAELEQRVQQLEGGVRELLDRIDRLTNRMDRFAPEISGPSAEDIQRFFGGRVFGVIGHRGEYGGWGGSPGALYSLSLRFTVQGERVEVETATVEPHDEQSALARLSLRALVPEGGDLVRPPLPLTLTLEERAARLRVCGREHDFNSYACSGRSIAFARIGDLWVTVESPTAFLDSQAFELHDEAEVNTGDEPQAAQ